MTGSTPVSHSLGRSLVSLLTDRYRLQERQRTVIGVAGESGSGKTITAGALARELESDALSTIVLHQDDYFRLPPRANHEHRSIDLANVGPHEVNLDLLRAHIAAFRAGRDAVTVPLVDYPSDQFLTRHIDFGAARVLIVEGTYVLLLEECDVRIFLAATHEETDERRRRRNRDAYEPIIDRILAIEHELVVAQRHRAEIVIDRDFAIERGG